MQPNKKSCKSILFLTDNEIAARPLVDALAHEGFTVSVHAKTEKQLDGYAAKDVNLIIIDSSTFSLEELSTYSQIRAGYTGLLMVLIDDIDEMLQVLVFEQGVDDLLIKPVNHLLMLARTRALLRRNGYRVAPINLLLFEGLEINSGLRRATYLGQEIPLTSREFDLLWHLAKNAYTTLDRDQLYKAVLGIDYNGHDRYIDMYVARIRSKMSPYPNLSQMIKTVRGNGYLFAVEQ